MGDRRATGGLHRDRPMDSESGIGEGVPALCPSWLSRFLRVARRSSLCRRDGDLLGRNDDRRGNILLLDCCWGAFSESYCTKPYTASSSWLSAAGRASGSSRGPGLGRSSTQPPPEATSTGLGTSPPGCRRRAIDLGAGSSTGFRGRGRPARLRRHVGPLCSM